MEYTILQKTRALSKSYITKIVNQIRDVTAIITPDWHFNNSPFEEVISLAKDNDLIYCDPPYLGRYVDYYNGWSELDEEKLYNYLSSTKARFILSTWHHNDYRENQMINKFWKNFNIATQDHFYHSGGKIENRRSIVEALVFNFESNIKGHNHSIKAKPKQLQWWDLS